MDTNALPRGRGAARLPEKHTQRAPQPPLSSLPSRQAQASRGGRAVAPPPPPPPPLLRAASYTLVQGATPTMSQARRSHQREVRPNKEGSTPAHPPIHPVMQSHPHPQTPLMSHAAQRGLQRTLSTPPPSSPDQIRAEHSNWKMASRATQSGWPGCQAPAAVPPPWGCNPSRLPKLRWSAPAEVGTRQHQGSAC